MLSVTLRDIQPTVGAPPDYRVMATLNASLLGVEPIQNVPVIEPALIRSALILVHLRTHVHLKQNVYLRTIRLTVAVLLAPLGTPDRSVSQFLSLNVQLTGTAPVSLLVLMKNVLTLAKY